ncbi:aminoglycoside phosphotransferase family protein [Pseudonocardia sp. ICBG162]|uniref:aminoglycoside phosphotransferase family protein n=1 Tax=Pseudonocardia sp. ICBG162 TaxID=2846761 RepID=UPI0027DF134E|nr:aminoglycoside phosphotransferase family protein [Pseudonocardia sp. ICBG162]
MHTDEVDVNDHVVRELVRVQFPEWADLPVRRLDSGGSTNAIFRVGTTLSARLPLTAGGVEGLHRETRWLPVLASASPVPVPDVVAIGRPGGDYPFDWAVHRWIDGEVLVEGRVPAPDGIARDLAAFIAALHEVDVTGAPQAHRSGTLADRDAQTRSAVEELARTDEPFDPDEAIAVWESVTAVPAPGAPARWIHSDLMPSNLLTRDGQLTAVIDFSTAGLGDRAVDLIPAWNLLPPAARSTFRAAVGVDDDTWERGRGWALSMALIQLPYYRGTNPVISSNARHVIEQVLDG